MCADDDRRLRPDQRRGVEADAGLREHLRPDRVGEPRPEPGADDLPAPCELQPGAGLAHRRRHRPLAGGDLRRHHRDEVGPDVELELHAGLTSSVQTSRSRSRTGSPCTTKASPSSTSRSPGRGVATSLDPHVEPRRLRPEPRFAEVGDRIGAARDDADGERVPVRRLVGRRRAPRFGSAKSASTAAAKALIRSAGRCAAPAAGCRSAAGCSRSPAAPTRRARGRGSPGRRAAGRGC